MNATNLYLKCASAVFALAVALGISHVVATGMQRSADDARVAATAQKPSQVAQNQSAQTAHEPVPATASRID